MTLYLSIVVISLASANGLWNLRSENQDKSTLQKVAEDKRHVVQDSEFYNKFDIDKMGADELAFLFFTNHDFDQNYRLDGLELLKAMHHRHAHEDDRYQDGHITDEAKEKEFWGTVDLIDRLLREFDIDDDGLLSFTEFIGAFNSDLNIVNA